jgi:hypothetical protein
LKPRSVDEERNAVAITGWVESNVLGVAGGREGVDLVDADVDRVSVGQYLSWRLAGADTGGAGEEQVDQ